MKQLMIIVMLIFITITSLSCSSRSGERVKNAHLYNEIKELKSEVKRLELEKNDVILCDIYYDHIHLCPLLDE